MQSVGSVIDKVDKISLAHSFQDACSDKEFKEYVYSLDTSEEILMKYTSRLEESFQEHKNCAKCKNLDSCQNKVKGYKYTPTINPKSIDFSYFICEKKKTEEERLSYQNNLELFDMPKDIKDASFSNIYRDSKNKIDDKAREPIIKYFQEFIKKYNNGDSPKGIYLTGSYGSGKTYLIAALFNKLAKDGIKSALVYYPELLRSLKSSFATDFNEKFNYIKKVPLLLIDDIGAENCSNWSRDEILGPILQYRMDNHLATFFTSNLTLEELEESLSLTSSGVDKVKARRIIERIKQLTITLELISASRRN